MKRPSRSPPLIEENVPVLRILAHHCMPHAAVPWLVSEHVVMPFTAVPSMKEIERATESAHREANAENASTVDHEAITARNAVPVAMLQWVVDAAQLPRQPARNRVRWTPLFLEQLCSLSHNEQSLKQLATMTIPPSECLLRPFLQQWCLVRLCGAETAEEQQMLDTLLHMDERSYICVDELTPFLATPVGRDEFFLRVARWLGSKYIEGQDIGHEAALLHGCLERAIRSRTDLNVFATAEFFDGFFLKFAWLHRNDALLSVIAHSSTKRCRALLTPAFRDAYFLGTIDRLQCDTFHAPDSWESHRFALKATWQCKEVVTAAAAKGVRLPCTVALADFIVSLTEWVLAWSTAYLVDQILRASTDFGPLRTAVFRDSFLLKAADYFAHGTDPGEPLLIHILALVAQGASPAEVEVFATEGVRDRLIVPFSLRLTDAAYMRFLRAAQWRATLTRAFNAIARTEDGSLRAVFDTEAVRSNLSWLVVRSRQPKRGRRT